MMFSAAPSLAPLDPIVIGQLGAPHGIQGWMKIHSYTQTPDHLFHYQPWLCLSQQNWYVIACDDWRVQSQRFVGHIQGCDDRNKAALYTQLELYVPRAQLPILNPDEYYWHDLIGLRVINQDGIVLGTLDDFFHNGANDVMVVIGERERLIPYILDEVIARIDLENDALHVIWDAAF